MDITVKELAEQLGVTPKHISHVERGVASLSLLNLAEVSRIFDCSLDYLVFGKENDKVLSLLPDLMIQILSSGTDKEIRRVQKYLDFYQELIESQDTI